MKNFKIGDKLTRFPLIQGGMGVGISLGTVAKEGGIGIISTAQIGYREKDFDRNTEEANQRAILSEMKKARRISPDGIIGYNIPDLFDPARGRIHLDEAALCHFRNDRCDRRLPASRRAKKKEGWDRIPLYHAIKKRLPSNGSILSDDVFKPPGAHAIRQGGIPLPRLRGHVE